MAGRARLGPDMTRDDHEALYAQHDELVRELATLDDRLGDRDGLAAARDRLSGELRRVRADLAERAASFQPIQLRKVKVARPCKESWDDMQGDDQVRHCRRCDKPVFNLSEMTAAEGEAVLRAHGTTPCVRFYRRADGTVKTADCDAPRRWPVGIAAGAMAGAAAVAIAASPASHHVPQPPATVVPRPPIAVIAPLPTEPRVADAPEMPEMGAPRPPPPRVKTYKVVAKRPVKPPPREWLQGDPAIEP